MENYDIADYTVIDLETTGRNINECEIIELSAVKVRNGDIVAEYSTLIKPTKEIPYVVTKITGITNEMVSDAPNIKEKLPEFISFIGDDILLGHNIKTYDLHIINNYMYELGLTELKNDVLDTLSFSRRCDIDVPNHKLTTLTHYFNIEHGSAHRALYDCIANHECYKMLKPLYNNNYKSKLYSTSRKRNFGTNLSKETQSLNELLEIMKDIISDGIIEDEEVYRLEEWLDNNRHLEGNYPFDTLTSTVADILEDNIITDEERDGLMTVIQKFTDPVENVSECTSDIIDISGKQICLTGEFIGKSRGEVTAELEKLGAVVKSGVSAKVNYLIVGGNGSSDWACGNYGSKVKKALELQEKGNDIIIIKEEDFFRCLTVLT